MKVFVTGAGGRIGRRLVKALRERTHDVKAPSQKQLDLVQASEKQIEEEINGSDAVVHLAASIDYSLPQNEMMKINFEATRKLAHACRKAGVRKLVYASSTSVYRGCRQTVVNEETKPRPVNAYGRSKLSAEQAIRDSGVPFVILRPCAVYGPEFEEGFGPLVRKIRDGKATMVGNGSNRVPFVFVEDVVDAFVKAVESKIVNKSFIICGNGEITQKQAFEKVAKLLGVKPTTKKTPAAMAYALSYYQLARQKLTGKRAKLLPEYVYTFSADRKFDNSNAKRLLGWTPKTSFESGLKKTLPALLKKK